VAKKTNDSREPIVVNRRSAIKLGGTSVMLFSVGTAGCWGPHNTLEALVNVKLADFPALAQDGGVVIIPAKKTGHSHDIIVRRTGGTYEAMSAECNHAGCNVERDGKGFACPCHGSEYAANGALVEGPATRSLLKFKTTLQGDTLTIANNTPTTPPAAGGKRTL